MEYSMSKDSKPAVVVPDNVKQLAAVLKPQITVDENGAAALPGDIWEKHLPEGATPKLVKAIDNSLIEFTAAQALALGEVALDKFKTDSSLQSVSISTDFGSGLARRTISQQVDREKTGRNPSSGETFTNYGVISSKIVQTGNGGLSKVKDHIKALHREALG